MTDLMRNAGHVQAASPALPATSAAAPADRATVRRAATVAGVSLLLIAVLAGVAQLVVVEGLVTRGDAEATAADVLASEGMFRLGLVGLYLAALLDVVAAWALLRVFSPVSADLSRLGAWLRLAYAAVFLVALSQLAGIPSLLHGSGDGAFTTAQLQAQALARYESFHDIWFAGLVLFGAHLAVTGYLAYRSGFVPRVIGVLLVVAGAGYVLDSVVDLSGDGAPFAVTTVTFLGELLLAVWLVLRGRRIELG